MHSARWPPPGFAYGPETFLNRHAVYPEINDKHAMNDSEKPSEGGFARGRTATTVARATPTDRAQAYKYASDNSKQK